MSLEAFLSRDERRNLVSGSGGGGGGGCWGGGGGREGVCVRVRTF